MKDVVRDVYLPLNSDSVDLSIRTDSVIGSGEKVQVTFYDEDTRDAGTVSIKFLSQIQYAIGGCTSSTPFPAGKLPTQTEKVWRFVYNPAELRAVYYCNEVEVLNVVLSDSVCSESGWRTWWEKKPTQIHFHSSQDTASEQYCLVGKVIPVVVGMYKW